MAQDKPRKIERIKKGAYSIRPNAYRIRPFNNGISIEFATINQNKKGSEDPEAQVRATMSYEMYKGFVKHFIVSGIIMQKDIETDIGFKNAHVSMEDTPDENQEVEE